jgi:hypothetical protein
MAVTFRSSTVSAVAPVAMTTSATTSSGSGASARAAGVERDRTTIAGPPSSVPENFDPTPLTWEQNKKPAGENNLSVQGRRSSKSECLLAMLIGSFS